MRQRNQTIQKEEEDDDDDDNALRGNGGSPTTTATTSKDEIIKMTPEMSWGTQGPSRIVRKLAMYRVVLFGILVRVSIGE